MSDDCQEYFQCLANYKGVRQQVTGPSGSALRHSYFTREMQAHEKSLPFEYAEVGVSLWLRWPDERAG